MNSESSQNASIDPDRVILANYAIAGATAPIELVFYFYNFAVIG